MTFIKEAVCHLTIANANKFWVNKDMIQHCDTICILEILELESFSWVPEFFETFAAGHKIEH